MKILFCFGTRPEIIKIAPVVREIKSGCYGLESILCSTGQHKTMVGQMLGLFDLSLDEDLDIMQSGQTVESVTSAILNRLGAVLDRVKPDFIMVQGDTTSAFVSGLLAFYRHIPLLYLEAGLRSGDMQKPWPEEANRRLLSVLGNHHFAPTQLDVDNLSQEGVNQNVHLVGNTVVDALDFVQNKMQQSARLKSQLAEKFSFIENNKKFILVTGHRRESHGGGHEQVFRVLRKIAEEKNIKIVFPVHLNPQVKNIADAVLSGCDLVKLLAPVNYLEMQYLLQKCFFVVTDSGGIQEEAPTYGKPLLVTRDVTERMAGVLNGSAILVGTDADKIYLEAIKLIDNEDHYSSMSKVDNPYGDGNAANRVCSIISDLNTALESKSVEVVHG